MTTPRRFGMGKGAVYPHQKARMLLNPLRRFVQSPERLAARLDLAPGAWVLELGPGPGYFSPAIAQRIPDGRLVLFDLQAEMLAMARHRLRAAACPNFAAVQGDALALPFAAAAFDAAVLVAVLGEVPHPDQCLAEVRRVLRAGGLLCVSETRGDPDRIPYGRLEAMAVAAGFLAEPGRRGRGWTYTARFKAAAR
jgi:ubiquinone/menaquinone biosynthesis C-methylase UbiE